MSALRSRFLSDSAIREIAETHRAPVLALDCEVVRQQYADLQQALPEVGFYYAIKCFPNTDIVRTLNALGAGFDVATSGEIEMLRELHINPRACIHTHPIKSRRDIHDALRFGCTTFVVDNRDELLKFRSFGHRVGLILRVGFRSADAKVDLSRKFGCTPEEAPQLLALARDLGIRVKGLSFHVGSQSAKPDTHVAAIQRCVAIMREEHAQGGDMNLLDIGGGFPVSYLEPVPHIVEYCKPIREALKAIPEGTEVIAEPGRFLVAPAAMSIAKVIGKARRDGRWWYYLDDGVYGCYSGLIYDHAQYPIRSLKQGPTIDCTLVGPTCDSIDVVAESIQLPELEIGDVVVGEVMGAYTAATATDFNSLPRSEILVLNAPEQAEAVMYIA